MSDLSVVLISKDQVWNIARLIESVIQETLSIPSREIILVDSASVDGTVTVASRYPVKVLRLLPDQHLTAAAGRYVGYKQTRGDFVLFLDGDMELYPEWISRALHYLSKNHDVAALSGQLLNLSKSANSKNLSPLLNNDEMNVVKEIRYTGGATIFRRTVLEQVGSFNPYLYSDEEPELCIRIRQRGYRIMRLGYPIAYHYSDPKGMMSTIWGRWRRNLYLGAGQNIRYHLGSKMLLPYMKERGYGCLPMIGLILGVVSLILSIKFSQIIWFSIWLLSLLIVIFFEAIRKKSLYKPIASLFERIFVVDGTVRGFLMKPLDPEMYPGDFEIIGDDSIRS